MKDRKQYRLKKWYPSLDRRIEKGDIATFDGRHYRIVKEYQQYEDCGLTEGWYHFVKEEVENNPDFWELIEDEKPKPLFITDDGVEVLNEETAVYCITRGHNKHEENYRSMRKIESYLKVFFHESSADEYIWRNKPVFSYEEIWKYAPYGSPLSIFEQLAKERAKE